MSSISREIEILKMNQKEILEVKTLEEIKNTFDGYIHRLDS